jgi:hypothetical protein
MILLLQLWMQALGRKGFLALGGASARPLLQHLPAATRENKAKALYQKGMRLEVLGKVLLCLAKSRCRASCGDPRVACTVHGRAAERVCC